MATDFTIVLRQRRHFGNERGLFDDIEPNVTFVGRDEDFPFDCPNVDTGAEAVLLFQTRDVDNNQNILTINDQTIFGGIPVSPNKETWNGNIALISRGTLRENNNQLHIGSRDSSGSILGDVDDFIIDNVVVLYKTR